MIFNKEQKKYFFIGLPTIFLSLALHLLLPNIIYLFHVILVFLIWLFVLFTTRTKKPIDDKFEYKEKPSNLLKKGICPFCEKNLIGEYRIDVGYTKSHFWMGYYFFFIKYSYNKENFVTSVPLCDGCKNRFLKQNLANPSYTVLKRKKGLSLGLKDPFSKNHLFKPDS